MDDIIKLLQELMSQKPRPKGGIADTAEGVEFLGKALSKEQQGSLMIVNSRLTDASRFEPFSIGNVGRDKRFTFISDYEQSLTDEFNKTVEFLKANPDIRLSQTQKDNIFYNLGVYRRITAEKNTLEKGIIEDGKKPSNVRDMEGNVLDPNEPIMGGTQVKESSPSPPPAPSTLSAPPLPAPTITGKVPLPVSPITVGVKKNNLLTPTKDLIKSRMTGISPLTTNKVDVKPEQIFEKIEAPFSYP